jgi:hypothetical protein
MGPYTYATQVLTRTPNKLFVQTLFPGLFNKEIKAHNAKKEVE